jgi:hypothetical protein
MQMRDSENSTSRKLFALASEIELPLRNAAGMFTEAWYPAAQKEQVSLSVAADAAMRVVSELRDGKTDFNVQIGAESGSGKTKNESFAKAVSEAIVNKINELSGDLVEATVVKSHTRDSYPESPYYIHVEAVKKEVEPTPLETTVTREISHKEIPELADLVMREKLLTALDTVKTLTRYRIQGEDMNKEGVPSAARALNDVRLQLENYPAEIFDQLVENITVLADANVVFKGSKGSGRDHISVVRKATDILEMMKRAEQKAQELQRHISNETDLGKGYETQMLTERATRLFKSAEIQDITSLYFLPFAICGSLANKYLRPA